MKRNIITLIALAALVSLSAVAFAAPRGGRGPVQQEQSAITPEKRAAIQKIIEAHQDKLYELREKIWAKHAELQALSNSGKAEKSDIQALIGDISKLRDAMHQERLSIRSDIEKQTGLKGYGGYHRGGMGGGMGYGGGYGACGDDASGCSGGGYHGKGFGRGMNACPGGTCN